MKGMKEKDEETNEEKSEMDGSKWKRGEKGREVTTRREKKGGGSEAIYTTVCKLILFSL